MNHPGARKSVDADHTLAGGPVEGNQGRSWPQLNEAAFHGLAGEIVRVIEPETEADPAALLVQFLAALGSVIGRGPHVAVEGDEHHANLFAVMVGDTAKGRKGTSWSRIRQLFRLVDAEWAQERVLTGLSSGEGLIWQVRDPEEDPSDDPGEKRKEKADPGVEDKRLLVLEDEFATVLRVMARVGSTLSPIVRRAWDRGDLDSLTKNCRARATQAHISIVGHITSDELRRYLDRTEAGNGFANRFLFICVQRSKYLPEGGSLSEDDLRPLALQLELRIDAARKVGVVSRTARARAVWAQVYPRLSAGVPGLFGAVTSRAEAQVTRLALIYALMDGCDQIDVQHLQAALAIWEYAEASARYVFGDSFGDPVADQIYRALVAAGQDGMTRTDISKLFGKNKDAGSLERALKLLADRGSVSRRRVAADGRGRPTEVWTAVNS